MMTTADNRALDSYARLMSANGAAQIYRAALQAGVLQALANGPASAAAVAAACGTAIPPTTLLLDGLVALDLVEPAGDAYGLAPVARFLAGPYQDLGDSYWSHLPAFLKTGEPMARMDDARESERQYQAQATALSWMMAPAAEAAATVLDIGGRRRGIAVLDVGAGAAGWSLALARRDAATTVTALDWPGVLAIAQKAAAEAGLQERFATIAGDYHKVALPEAAFDLAIMANVAHLETAAGNRGLFERLSRSLRPGGEIAVIDVFPVQAAGALPAALYALGLALRTTTGRVHSAADLESWLAATGLDDCRFTSLDAPPYTMGMLLARCNN
jgi:ubiquinone/menaquinone biosynthesis C-methylase UbiE